MRIIAGKYKGLILEKIKIDTIRPTMDRSKESLFNIIQNEIIDADFLDLFSGSGNIGIEAISRGANSVCCVEKNQEAIRIINKNISKINDNIEIYKNDVESFLLKTKKSYDIIFMDPPYNYEVDKIKNNINIIKENNLLKENGMIIVEYGKEIKLENLIKVKKYGKSYFMFLKMEEK